MSDLFNRKTIDRLCQGIVLTDVQEKAANEWLEKLDQGRILKEKSNNLKFASTILDKILGYSVNDLVYEENNVEFQFQNANGKNVMCIETKGTDTKDLFAIQHRDKEEHKTPIKQTWDYIGKIGLDYGICTNYKHFVLITKEFGYSKYHFFNFNSIKNNKQKLREFIGIFSRERIIDLGFVETLQKESIIEERDITKEFYTLFHTTRLMLIKEFQVGFHKEFPDEDVAKNKAIQATQIFLNRLIFIFFVADRGFIPDTRLFTNRILYLLESGHITEHSTKIYDDIKELFVVFDKGSRLLSIFGFNGGLFDEKIFDKIMPKEICFSDIKNEIFFDEFKENSQLVKSIKLNENVTQIISKIPDLNPIIPNLLRMDSYDFNTDINVNILGRIFEQSISDLEELRKEGISQRKRDGVYYTPEYITDYICRNTIIPYLSKRGSNTVEKLISEYLDSVDELEDKFKKIKILDPACGSGAFLIKAIDILLEIHKEIQNLKTVKQHTNEQSQITEEWNEDQEIRTIIENNVYGIDINSESIEITKLSLFLKLASNERKLIGLSKNIQQGNSLVDDKTIDSRAFSWENEFPKVLGSSIKDKGFDIIIGNPPYGAELTSQEKEYLNKKFQIGSTDTAQLMMKRSYELLKSDGNHGFIVPKALIYANNWKKIRKFLLPKLRVILDVGKVWKEVKLEQTIYIVNKNSNANFYLNGIRYGEYLNPKKEIDKKHMNTFGFLLSDVSKEELELGEKIFSNSKRLNQYISNSRGSIYQRFVKEQEEIPVMGGKQIQRFYIDGIYGHISKKDIDEEKAHVTMNSILVQRLVAHILNPIDHIKITATIPDKDNFIIVDTINQLKIIDNDISPYYVLGLLNSKFTNWYAYRFIFGKAIRTMQFDNPITDRIPVVIDKQDKVISCVKKLLEQNKKLHLIQQKHEYTLKAKLDIQKINRKSLNINKLEFNDFSKHISKLIKRELSPKEISQWVEYFDEVKINFVKITATIKNLENELNQLFYSIFKLTKAEIDLIESSTPE